MDTDRIRAIELALALATCAVAQPGYQDTTYPSGKLKIQAYLFKPAGSGPFPVVIYNHGSRPGLEKQSMPFAYVGNMLTAAGFVVLVPERRGYGTSDGVVFSKDVGSSRSKRYVERLQEETQDALRVREHYECEIHVDALVAA